MKDNRSIKDSYYIEQDNYTLEVFYHYYSERDTNYEELEIEKVILNGDTDVTGLYWDYIDLEDEIMNSLDL
tara:strand:- start:6445 stop:6657 length:213 start_codon:yes stop_codon:yes gene_type:complete